jgi:hypothetical protein
MNIDDFKQFALLSETNPKAADLIFQGILSDVGKSQEIHFKTPNSCMQFIEDAVKEFGTDNVFELSDTLCDFGLFDSCATKVFWDEEDCENELELFLDKIILHPENEYKDKLEFVFHNYDYLREEDETIKLPDGVEYDEDGVMTASFYGSEMDYCELEQSVREIILCLKTEYNEMDCRWFLEDVYRFLRGHKYILSYERSLANPKVGCSLVIRKDTYPENCYAYKRFNTFESALNFREKIHDKILSWTPNESVEFFFDDGPSDICTFSLPQETMQKIVDFFGKHRRG